MAQKAGPISGNPLCGLCERICVNVRKVFDGCITRYQDRRFSLTFAADLSLQGDPPYTYVEARSSGPSQISNLIVTPISDDRNRIQMNVTTPVTVTYRDSNGDTFTADTSVTIARDIVLNLPEDSLSPYTIEVATSLASNIGEFVGNNTVVITACVVQIIRVIVNVDVLIPSYGYCTYPSCEEFSDEVCQGLFNLPIFPSGT
ncbi:MAG: hypothetical protein J1F36_05045 [Clostridiales bacterium]|nr:hypothetical protein [Clostridiales bacterium]